MHIIVFSTKKLTEVMVEFIVQNCSEGENLPALLLRKGENNCAEVSKNLFAPFCACRERELFREVTNITPLFSTENDAFCGH